jgi:hypothetical protein
MRVRISKTEGKEDVKKERMKRRRNRRMSL